MGYLYLFDLRARNYTIGDPFPFSPQSVLRRPLLLHPRFIHFFPILLYFLVPLNLPYAYWPAKKITDSCKSWRGQKHLVRVIPEVGVDASYGRATPGSCTSVQRTKELLRLWTITVELSTTDCS